MKKEMPRERLEKEIKLFLKERKILVLCTSNTDCIPRATPMDFYMERGIANYNLYVGPSPGRKVDNIKANPHVSIGIYTPLDTGKIQGMQITANGKERLVFLEEGDEGFKEAQKIVRGKRELILKIIPEKMELLDYDFVQEDYSRFQTLDLKA